MGSGTSKQETQAQPPTAQNRDLPGPSHGPHPASKPRANAATAAAERLSAAFNDSGPKGSDATSLQQGYTLDGVQEEDAMEDNDDILRSPLGVQGSRSNPVPRTEDNDNEKGLLREDPLSTTKFDMEKFKRANKEKFVDASLVTRGAPRYSIHSEGPRQSDSHVPRTITTSKDELDLKPVPNKNESGFLDPSDEEFMSEILKETEFLVLERNEIGAI
ncbi:hypothetical protein BJ742DRAFT_851678 [Cladochytrium replicatum]|nr:hypothetical protein BJ742DRAFT_851678 [Cladochytrium replicatum]